MYLDQDNIPLYVGKGKGNRYLVSSHLGTSNPLLKNKILEIGKKNVQIEFPHKDLIELESFDLEEQYIQRIGRRDLNQGPLYNLTNGGEGSSGHNPYWKGRHHSKETKRKLSLACTGYSHTEEAKRKIGLASTARKRSEETRIRMSEGNKGKHAHLYGRFVSEETRRRISESNSGHPSSLRGIPRSDEVKRKISNAQKGRVFSEEHKQHMRKPHKSYVFTEAHKQHLRKPHKLYDRQ